MSGYAINIKTIILEANIDPKQREELLKAIQIRIEKKEAQSA